MHLVLKSTHLGLVSTRRTARQFRDLLHMLGYLSCYFKSPSMPLAPAEARCIPTHFNHALDYHSVSSLFLLIATVDYWRIQASHCGPLGLLAWVGLIFGLERTVRDDRGKSNPSFQRKSSPIHCPDQPDPSGNISRLSIRPDRRPYS